MFIKASFFSYMKLQLYYLFYNHFITHIPLLFFRMFFLRMGVKNWKENDTRYRLVYYGTSEFTNRQSYTYQ